MKIDKPASDVYLDFSGFAKMRSDARDNNPDTLKAVAKQFESLFMQMMLKTMRQANESFGKDGIFKSDALDSYQEMYDSQLALTLSSSKGMGLSDVLVRQLGGGKSESIEPDKELRHASFINNLKQQIRYHADAPSSINPTTAETEPMKIYENPAEFVKALWPHAVEVAKKMNLDPKVLIAQAALETGWGKSIIQDKDGKSSFNLFNIKTGSHWTKDKVNVTTTEYEHQKSFKTVAPFRKYESFGESFSDYFQLLSQNERYQTALQKADNPHDYVQSLQEAGYATDPHYADKILQIYHSDLLNEATKEFQAG